MAIRQNPRIRPMKPWILRHERCNWRPAWPRESRRWFRSSSSPLATDGCFRAGTDVEVAEVLQSDIKIHRQWVATLEGFVNADIRPQVEGYVRKQAYRDGATCRQETSLPHRPAQLPGRVGSCEVDACEKHRGPWGKARLDVKRDRELIAGQIHPATTLEMTSRPSSKRRRTSARPAPILPRRSSPRVDAGPLASFGHRRDCPAARSAVSSARPPS